MWQNVVLWLGVFFLLIKQCNHRRSASRHIIIVLVTMGRKICHSRNAWKWLAVSETNSTFPVKEEEKSWKQENFQKITENPHLEVKPGKNMKLFLHMIIVSFVLKPLWFLCTMVVLGTFITLEVLLKNGKVLLAFNISIMTVLFNLVSFCLDPKLNQYNYALKFFDIKRDYPISCLTYYPGNIEKLGKWFCIEFRMLLDKNYWD